MLHNTSKFPIALYVEVEHVILLHFIYLFFIFFKKTPLF